MTRQVVEERIKGKGGEVYVRRPTQDGDDKVQVTWPSGDQVRFGARQLEVAMHYIETLGAQGVWVALKDSTGQRFVATLRGANIEVGPEPGEVENEIPWQALKDALQEALDNGGDGQAN